MRFEPAFHDASWVSTDERDSVSEITEIFVPPLERLPHATPAPMMYEQPQIRTLTPAHATPIYVPPPAPSYVPMYESFEPAPAMQPSVLYAPAPMPRQHSATHVVRDPARKRANMIGIGFLATCTMLGVLVGTLIAFRGSATASTDDEVTPAPAVATPMTVEPIAVAPVAPRPVVAPIEETAPAAIEAPAPTPTPTPTPTPAPAAKPKKLAKPELAKPDVAVTEAPRGTLRVSSKPPCAISIDDHATGLTTPQASIPLAAGHHEVTLTNAEQGIQITAEVDIAADHVTPLIEDFTK